ncbi:hypothetical protein [Bombilactobacillus bombi]|uniref:hypothetical protein n=1 Tax=Bombilactobacillus bombi TaxID=1303590 RepID=UPI0015E605FE|nr:hypothetical protein [Bombilactobacillus bombi]MBA1394649.1 hypothetical protein [Lactobacillus sp. XV13L]MBA1434690.1 hypothetical protein [Bombilactobacillus bombi]
MKITVAQYQEQIAQENYQNFTVTVQLTRRLGQAKLKAAITQLIQQVQTAVDSGYLAQGQLVVTGLPMTISFALQTGIINLPFQDYQKISHFFDKEEVKKLQVYLVTFSDYINVSHLRIDQVAEDPSHLSVQTAAILEMVHTNLKQALANYDQQDQRKEEPQK